VKSSYCTSMAQLGEVFGIDVRNAFEKT